MSTLKLSAANIERHAAPLRKQVVEELRRAIVTNAYAPGSRLVERVLCEELRVSRTVIREALRQLESEQLIDMVPNIGSIVRYPGSDEVRSLYEVRGSLEALAAARCAENVDGALVTRLREALESIPPAGSEISERLAAQDSFVAILVKGSGNVVVGDMLSSIHSRVRRLRAITLASGGRDRLIPGLTRIFDAIAAGDVTAAERTTREYVAEAAGVALEALSIEQNQHELAAE